MGNGESGSLLLVVPGASWPGNLRSGVRHGVHLNRTGLDYGSLNIFTKTELFF